MTISLRSRVELAERKLRDAQDAIYAAGPSREVTFSECCKLAAIETVAAWSAAREELCAAEQAAIDKAKAWRGALGLLHWYSA